MQALKLPALAGLIWISAGFRLMFQQFFRMFAIVLINFFLFVLAGTVAELADEAFKPLGADPELVGRVILFGLNIFSPVFLVGFMEACRGVTLGERISPLYCFRGFQLGRPAFNALLGLGLFQTSALTIASAFLPDTAQTSLDELIKNASSTAPAMDPHEMLIRFATIIPVVLVLALVWYAPMLAAWHGMRPIKAMFFSVAACWRNKTAFIMLGAGWMIILMFLSSFMLALVAAMGLSNLSYALVTVFVLIMLGAMFCSGYVTYSTVFVPAPKGPAA